ncbi:MAG TPA: hemin uptake protein HemP [Comamonadaceae bacterium]|uniref:hemin uptake protein HemP n=1 Tax=Pulveribacter sp. TaxID=2678893 RepID=UPI000ED191A1|nr:hemin uptake protein HemP [Pulveribacter sp.]HCL87030.1 hemin uptake protein HemP [Comamonadaceae bacterium]
MSAVLTATPTLPATAPAQDARPAADGRHALDSTALLQGRKAVTIVHNGAFYQLQATKLGKLILTK